MSKCSECGVRGGHKPGCSLTPPPRGVQPPPEKRKQNFKKRPDDGRSRP